MDAKTKQFVRDRAGNACEYYRLPHQASPVLTFHVEHITARQHGGTDDPGQLALACDRCNAYKGPNLTSIDRESGNIVPLFHPRVDRREEHFRLRGGMVVGVTPTGRATVTLLNMDSLRRVQLREEWLDETEG